MTNDNKPLSEILPGLAGVPSPATGLEELAGVRAPVPRIVPRPAPPINLPTYVFLTGHPQKCWDLAAAIALQDQTVYLEDLKLPIYDAVSAVLELGYGKDLANPICWTEPHDRLVGKTVGDVIQDITKVLRLDYLNILFSRTEELLAANSYRFVIRDTDLVGANMVEAHPDTTVVDANLVTLEQLREIYK